MGNTNEKEHRSPGFDTVWDSSTVDEVPDLLHQLYYIIVGNGPSVVTISVRQILYIRRDEDLSPNTIILGA